MRTKQCTQYNHAHTPNKWSSINYTHSITPADLFSDWWNLHGQVTWNWLPQPLLITFLTMLRRCWITHSQSTTSLGQDSDILINTQSMTWPLLNWIGEDFKADIVNIHLVRYAYKMRQIEVNHDQTCMGVTLTKLSKTMQKILQVAAIKGNIQPKVTRSLNYNLHKSIKAVNYCNTCSTNLFRAEKEYSS